MKYDAAGTEDVKASQRDCQECKDSAKRGRLHAPCVLDSPSEMARRRLSGVTLLAAAVLVLLPALAWLQYSWLDQVADADRQRRARTLQRAVQQLAHDLEAEMGRAVFALQIDPAEAEQRSWSQFAAAHQLWATTAPVPRIVDAVYFVEAPAGGSTAEDAPPLLKWDGAARRFERTPWPDDLDALRARFLRDVKIFTAAAKAPPGEARDRVRGALQRLMIAGVPGGDARSVMTPVLRGIREARAGENADAPPDIDLLGFTILRFNLGVIATELLPSLVRRHLYDENGHTDYAIAVVTGGEPTDVVFESEPGASAMASARPDVAIPLLGARTPFFIVARARFGWPGATSSPPPPPPLLVAAPASLAPDPRAAPDRASGIESEAPDRNRDILLEVADVAGGPGAALNRTGRSEGLWRLVATHRAGSLEAAVAAARTRNLVLGSGILALLAVSIGLIVVSARRADRLARQQLEFVAAVSHELRTPVSVIGTAAGNLADGVVEEPGRVRQYGAAIQAQARRLGDTVERVLQLAGIAAGATLQRDTVPIHRLVEDAVAACRAEAAAAGVAVEVDLAPELRAPGTGSHSLAVRGDAAALRSALQNLLGNAIKYAGEARWVRVSARRASPRSVRISVTDRGLGIPGAERQRIFEPFYRGHDAVLRQIPGSGLGLHIVRRIVESHGGSIEVTSEPGRGSTFSIDVPGVVSETEPGTACDAGADSRS